MIMTWFEGRVYLKPQTEGKIMQLTPAIWPNPAAHLRQHQPDQPVYYFIPSKLQETARSFIDGYPGLVTYAVKANDAPEVLENLVAAGIRAFDVASISEIRSVLAACPDAVLHYNNPVRSMDEIRQADGLNVRSYSIDSLSELEKIADVLPPYGVEISVRLKLPIEGAKYDFGSKFGAEPAMAQRLLRRVDELGYKASMTFHPGTQCADPAAWVSYISVCADIARRAGVEINRLNTGGGYAAHRKGAAPEIIPIFTAVKQAVAKAFPDNTPQLICEPGRAMVADSFVLATRVKALREDDSVFLNDGIYGSFCESPSMGTVERVVVLDDLGNPKAAQTRPRVVFGPTCDSLDRLPEPVQLPHDLSEGDYVLFHGMGAYASATVTRFNGYGDIGQVTVKAAC